MNAVTNRQPDRLPDMRGKAAADGDILHLVLVALADLRKELFVGGHHVVARARAEHTLAAPAGVIAVGKAGAREHAAQLSGGLVGDKAEVALFNARADRSGNVFGAFHSALDFRGSHADFLHIRQKRNQAVVL